MRAYLLFLRRKKQKTFAFFFLLGTLAGQARAQGLLPAPLTTPLGLPGTAAQIDATGHLPLGEMPTALPGCIPGMSCPLVGAVYNVAVAIPAIAAGGEATVQVTIAGILPGDRATPTLAPGSAAPPSGVSPSSTFCTVAGTLNIKYNYLAGALGGTSAATNVVANFTITR